MKQVFLFIAFQIYIVGFSFSQTESSYRILTPAQMQADLNILRSAWTNLHPGLYRYNSPAQITSYFASLQKTCSIPMDERRFYILLSQLAEKIKCGHTYLNPNNLEDETAKRILPTDIIPFFFEVLNENKFIITHNLSEVKDIVRGDEIVAINGIQTKTIIDSLLTVSRSDGNGSKNKKLNNINETPDEADAHSLFDIYFPLFFPSPGHTVRFTIRKFKGGRIVNTAITYISLEERMKRYESSFGKVPVDEKTWDYKMLSNNTAYMKFGTFAFWNSPFKPKRYIDSIFNDLLSKTNIKHLVVDIRNNEGGDNSGDHILSYLTHKKIGCDDPDRRCYRYVSIPDSLLPYLSTWDKSFKKPKDTSKFFVNDIGLFEQRSNGNDCDFIEPQSKTFRGNVYLLTNAKNSSAGYEMARTFQTAKLGKIIGEQTGGSQQGINGGEFFFLQLPNSKFEIDLPLIYNYHANKPDKGISPDHKVGSTQKDIYENKDTQLQFVLSLIGVKNKR